MALTAPGTGSVPVMKSICGSIINSILFILHILLSVIIKQAIDKFQSQGWNAPPRIAVSSMEYADYALAYVVLTMDR